MGEALAEALSTKNSQRRIKGFTPCQWVFGKLPREPGMASGEKMDMGVIEAMADERHEFARVNEVREAARKTFIKEDLSRRVAKALLRKAAPINKEYGVVGDLVCFKTEQSGWSTASRVIGFEGPKIVWLIHQGLPVCVALDRLRPVNASEALAYQHLKDEKGLGAISRRKIGFIDAREPLEMIEEEGEDDYPPPTPIEEDEDGIVRNEEEDSAQQNTERRRSIAGTVDEPDEEMIPSRRRSRNDLLDDVPIAIRRRLSSGSVRSESRASAGDEEETSRPAESRAEPSPLAEAMNRAGTTGSGVDLVQEGWNRSHFANDTWQYLPEHGLLIRKHETPRTALFCPDSVKCPVETEQLSNIRITEMALDHGGFKRKHDTWEEGSCVNMDSEWTGKKRSLFSKAQSPNK